MYVGADLEFEHKSGLDVRLRSPDFALEMNDAHSIRRWLPGCVAVGDADGLLLVECVDGLFAVGAGALDRSEF